MESGRTERRTVKRWWALAASLVTPITQAFHRQALAIPAHLWEVSRDAVPTTRASHWMRRQAEERGGNNERIVANQDTIPVARHAQSQQHTGNTVRSAGT